MRGTFIHWANHLLEYLVIGAIGIMTLGFGGRLEWAFAVGFGFLTVAVCLWAAMRLLENDPTRRHRSYGDFDYATAPSIVFNSFAVPWMALAVAGYLMFQMIPLPTPMTKVLSPVRVEREQTFRTALNEPIPSALPLTINSLATVNSMPQIAVAVIAFTLGAYLATNRRRVRRFIV